MLKLNKKEELIAFLTKYKSEKNATVITKTSVKMNKKDVATKSIGNPYSDIGAFKVSIFNATVNFDYEDKVNDQRLLEGKDQDFEKKESRWGEQVSKALEIHNDTTYVRLIPEKKIVDPMYELGDGTRIEYKELAPFINNNKPKSTTQDLESEVQFRKYKIDSIISFKIDGIVEYIAV